MRECGSMEVRMEELSVGAGGPSDAEKGRRLPEKHKDILTFSVGASLLENIAAFALSLRKPISFLVFQRELI